MLFGKLPLIVSFFKEWRLRDEKKVDIVNNETLIMRFKRVL